MEQTRGAIIKAFGQLLEEKPMNKITVKDIVERCGINRNTFYYHFRDIPTLFEQMMEDRVEQLVQNHYQPSQPIECIRPMLYMGLHTRTRSSMSIGPFLGKYFYPTSTEWRSGLWKNI